MRSHDQISHQLMPTESIIYMFVLSFQMFGVCEVGGAT